MKQNTVENIYKIERSTIRQAHIDNHRITMQLIFNV